MPETGAPSQPKLDAAAPPRAGEQQGAKEKVSKEVQQKEILQMGSAGVQSLGKELDEMEASKQSEALQDAGNRAILSLYRLPYQEPFDSNTKPGGLPLDNPNDPNDKPIIVKHEGKNEVITSIKWFDGEKCVCRTESGGTIENVPITEVLRGQLLASSDSILTSTQFSQAEKDFLKLYIDFARDGESGIPNLGSEEIDAIIIQGAKEIGVTSNVNLEGFINKLMPEVKPKEGETLTEAQVENNNRREAALKKLEGKNLADAQTVIEVVKTAGLSTESAEASMAQAEEKVKKLEEVLKKIDSNHPEYKKYQEELNQAKMEHGIWKTATEILKDPKKLQDKFDQVNKGQYKRETAVKFCQALEKGDIEEMINLLMPYIQEKDRLALAAYLKGGGIAAFLLSFLINSLYGEIGGGQQQ